MAIYGRRQPHQPLILKPVWVRFPPVGRIKQFGIAVRESGTRRRGVVPQAALLGVRPPPIIIIPPRQRLMVPRMDPRVLADKRLRSHTEIVQAILNSLIRQDILVQSDTQDWTIDPTGGGSGLTGTFP